MKKLIMAAGIGVICATGAMAEETYREELYENGSIRLNNVESQVREILADNGVSSECMLSLSFTDVASIAVQIERSDINAAGKRRQVKLILDDAGC